MAEFLAEALERELDSGIKELVIILQNSQPLLSYSSVPDKPVFCFVLTQGIFFQERSLFSSFLATSAIDIKIDMKSRAASCFLELPHFPQAFRSDVDQLQVQLVYFTAVMWVMTCLALCTYCLPIILDKIIQLSQ